MNDLISRQDAIDALQSRQTEVWEDADIEYNEGIETALCEIKALQSAEPKTGECSGCKFIGSYDLDFPCVNCVRKTKDYYCGARMRGEDDE